MAETGGEETARTRGEETGTGTTAKKTIKKAKQKETKPKRTARAGAEKRMDTT